MGISSIVGSVIGTAGHIDHGKSALIRRLTGIEPDRCFVRLTWRLIIRLTWRLTDSLTGRLIKGQIL